MLFALFLVGICVNALPFDLDLEAAGGAKVRFSLVNTESETLTFLRWGTPLDKSDTVFRSDMFAVQDESGNRATYAGILVKRFATVADFVAVNPGQTLTTEVDLTKGYMFRRAGTYTVWLSTVVSAAKNSTTALSQFEDFEVTSEPVKVQISSSEVLPIVHHPFIPRQANLTVPTDSCTASQTNDINTADANGKTLINRLQSYLTSCTQAGYVTWMGKCDDARYKTVDTNIDNIKARINAAYKVNCAGSECSNSIYAYVYPTDTSSHTVYVCGAFWSAPIGTCNTDSKPGTIIHELSHFNDVAGTNDYKYGWDACKALAISNPAQAVKNADSYEYFSESCY